MCRYPWVWHGIDEREGPIRGPTCPTQTDADTDTECVSPPRPWWHCAHEGEGTLQDGTPRQGGDSSGWWEWDDPAVPREHPPHRRREWGRRRH